MTVTEVKATIAARLGVQSIGSLILVYSEDEAGVINEDWPEAWIPEERARIVMHKSVMERFTRDPHFAGLGLKPMEVIPEKVNEKTGVIRASYKKFMVICPKNIAATM